MNRSTSSGHRPRSRVTARCLRAALGLLAAGALLLALPAGAAWAAAPAPAWTLDSQAVPSNFSAAENTTCPGDLYSNPQQGCDAYELTATDAGAQATDGSPITLSDILPPGVTVQRISLFWRGPGSTAAQGQSFQYFDLGGYLCDTATVQCTFPGILGPAFGVTGLQPDDVLQMLVYVTVDDPSATGTLSNAATISGGGAAAVSATSQNTVGESAPPFGFERFSSLIAGPDGQPDSQAGDHPYELSTRIDLNSLLSSQPPDSNTHVTSVKSVEDVKDVSVDLPLGFMGSALAAPQCTLAQLSTVGSVPGASAGCAPDTVVGQIWVNELGEVDGVNGPIYNLVPERGVAAEFGFIDLTGSAHILYASVVPTPDGYVLRTTSPDLSQISLYDILVTFYGDPAAKDQSSNTPVPMFTNPTECNGQPVSTAVHIDSWQHPGRLNPDGTPDLSDPNWVSATSTSPPMTGCNKLSFNPSLSVQPDTTVADSPSGLHVDISVAQSESPSALATPPLRNASVTLPPGFTVNPSSAAGLKACTPAQIGLGSASAPTCPDASKIGTVSLQTPLLPGTLTGSIYLAQEFQNPFNSLLAGYIVVNDPATGVVIKIPGNLTPDPLTGQITGVFDNNPQFPFSDLKLDFKGGATGVLATPEKCGAYTTNSLFSPWSAPDSGPAANPSDSFGITSGCVSGFKPSFMAGTQNPQAGAYSPFVLSMSRSDQQENFQGLSVTLPPGMLANLSHVQECSAADLAKISSQPGTGQDQINNPSCPAGSQVGTVTTGAGTGPDPYFLSGNVYLTGPYKGAPYGLAVVVPAVAGPLDLGTVVVRQALDVNPTTAQVTDVSDPFPTILDGIPLRIRRVDVALNRPKFTINPTSCDVMNVTGTATSTQGTSAPLSNRFQIGGCASLGFSPELSMKLTGKGRTRSGAHPNLVSVLTQKPGQANIHNVQVALPLSLALDPNNSQHVCPYPTAQAVTTGPANCPASTLVGHATAITPLLSRPLSGPVYLVQGIRIQNGVQIHTLPSLLIPLRGQIALDLRAQTSVSHGKLVTTFPIIPDAAVTKFTLTINGGRKGILVITGRGRTICGSPQVTQANLIAQNGKAEYPNIRMGTPCRAAHHKRKHRRHH